MITEAESCIIELDEALIWQLVILTLAAIALTCLFVN